MLFAWNAEHRPELWDGLADALSRGMLRFLVRRDELSDTPISVDWEDVFESFRKADLCLISASHGTAIPPHCAARLSSGVAELTDLLVASDASPRETSEAPARMAIGLFYANRGSKERQITDVVLPGALSIPSGVGLIGRPLEGRTIFKLADDR